MASFLGSIFGFEFGTKIYLFWRLWQVIPDWLVLDATGCEQSELLLLCCGSTSMIPAASLWNKSLATGCSMMVYPWVDTCCLLGFKTMQRNCRGTSKCLQSCWGLEKLVLVSWKCHAVAWHHGLYEIWRQACQWFGFAFRLCSWSCMLAPRKSMQADLHAARSPYVLIICSLPVVFVCNALFLFLRLYFHMYKPQTNLVNVCAQLISLRNEHFFWWHLRCAVFSYVQTPGILWKHLCAAHSIGESHAMTTPSICCVFICTNPNQTSILGSGRNLQLPRAKKEINWTFL